MTTSTVAELASSSAAANSANTAAAVPRALQVDGDTRIKPKIVDRLNDWQYLERSIQRLVCAWGRRVSQWDDKVAIHQHVWEQAQLVNKIRERVSEFPGGKPDAAVSARLERLANVVLLAPSLEDAIDGIYQVLGWALAKTYLDYAQQAHPVHDRPTIELLKNVVASKEQQRLWLRDRRRRIPHSIDADYRAAIEAQIAACENLASALPVEEDPAKPCGVRTEFRLPANAAKEPGWDKDPGMGSLISADFSTSVEVRRLFWAIGYMREMNLADEQLAWIYYADFMPWDFISDVSRHLWDESRHGNSGYSRLKDFGIGVDEVGFPYYRKNEGEWLQPLTPLDLYEAVFNTGMVAETGHFDVKHEAYADFREGGDMESAEMMLFDIIDETMHVQYAHRWLPELAKHAGLDNSDYRQRSTQIRKERQMDSDSRCERAKQEVNRSDSDPAYRLFQDLLQRMRERQPLSNAATCVVRSNLPM